MSRKSWAFVITTIIGIATAVGTFSDWHWGRKETRITASISFEKIRMPPEAEEKLGVDFFNKPHLHAWVYVNLQNNTETTAQQVSVTMPDTTVYSVPEENNLSSHVARGVNTYKAGNIAPGDSARVVFFTENLPKWEDLEHISVYQEGAKPIKNYTGPNGIVPVPFWHKQSVLILATSLAWILTLGTRTLSSRYGRREQKAIIRA